MESLPHPSDWFRRWRVSGLNLDLGRRDRHNFRRLSDAIDRHDRSTEAQPRGYPGGTRAIAGWKTPRSPPTTSSCASRATNHQRSEQRYRLITENTLDLICEVSQHGFYTYVSPNHQEILGYRSKELLGQNFSAFIHSEDVDGVVEQFSECIVASIPFVCTFRLRHRDGSWRWVEVSAKPLETVTAPGATRYEGQAIFVYRDVTERRETRRALATETERLAVTLSSIADGVISTDLGGHIVQANETASALLGVGRDALLGKLLDEHDRVLGGTGPQTPPQPDPSARWKTASTCQLPLSGHVLLRTPVGNEFSVGGAATPVRDQDEQILGAVLIFRNITERRPYRTGTPQAQQAGIPRAARRTHRARFQQSPHRHPGQSLPGKNPARPQRRRPAPPAGHGKGVPAREGPHAPAPRLRARRPAGEETARAGTARARVHAAHPPGRQRALPAQLARAATAGQRRCRAAPSTSLRIAHQRDARHSASAGPSTCAAKASTSTRTARCRCQPAITSD